MTALHARAGAPGHLPRFAAMLIAYQGAWFACVLGAAHGLPWAGTVVGLAVVAAFVMLGDRPSVDAKLIAVAVAVGLAWDTAMAQSGWVAYAGREPLASLAPGWILALWALFAVVLRGPLRWLHARLPVAAVLGAIGGPLSYAAAERMGAITMREPAQATVALALGWAAITPLLLALARRWDAR